jgi:lipopolysaccharide/colanic/teichoic acid biosynthesis glycosyltransferase
MTPWQRALKRSFDLLAAGAGLVVGAPLLLVIAMLVRLTTPGPALYRHTRVGRNGVHFEVWKFRTMVYAPGIEASEITIAGDPRITPLGRRLRRWKLDELPQLWNVIRGEMSLVGPRPDIPGYADRLTGTASRLLDLRPGITGPATLYYRDEEDLLASVDDPREHNDGVVYPLKVRLNLKYLEDWSLARDIGYLVVTVLPALDRWLHLVPVVDPDEQLTTCADRGRK